MLKRKGERGKLTLCIIQAPRLTMYGEGGYMTPRNLKFGKGSPGSHALGTGLGPQVV